ncbi:MAG: hypothetical protein Q6370_012770 [Candidatus Sigynarchaeota archaeon]
MVSFVSDAMLAQLPRIASCDAPRRGIALVVQSAGDDHRWTSQLGLIFGTIHGLAVHYDW